MSARKPIILKSTKKLPLSAKKVNLNSTAVTHNSNSSGRPRIYPNITNLPLPPKDDYESLYNTAFNDYLQACMKTNILTETIQQQRSVCSNQLEKQIEALCYKEEQTLELEIEIESRSTKVKLKDTLKELTQSVEDSYLILNSDVEKCIEKLIIILEKGSKKLFLNNVDYIESQDYEKLQAMLQKCLDVVKKFNSFTIDIDGTNKLSDCLDKNLKLQDELVTKNQVISNLQSEIGKLTLENASDLLDAL